MEHLWAPWRQSYVCAPQKANENLFDEIGRSNDDDQHFVIARTKSTYAVLNRFPYNTGHTLVVPYRAVSCLSELSEDETLDLWKLVNRVMAAMKATTRPQGINIGLNLGSAAGAGIPKHLHVHVVPRWENDANFMTATAETRIHPNDLPTVYRTLKDALASLPA